MNTSNPKMSNATTYANAGYIKFIKTLPDQSDSKNPDDIYTSGRNVAGVITPSYTLTTTAIESENSFYAAATRVTGVDSTVVVNFNSYDEALYAFGLGAKTVWVENEPMEFINQGKVVETDGTTGAVIKMGSALHEGTTVLVRDDYSNISLEEMTGTGTVSDNQFKVDYATGKITLPVALIGKALFVTGAFVAPKVKKIITPKIPKLSSYNLVIYSLKSDFKNTSDEIWESTIIDQVQFSGTISPPSKQKSPGTWSLTLTMQEPRTGREAMVTKSCNPIVSSTFKTLTLASAEGTAVGKTAITVTEAKDINTTYVYKTAATVTMPIFGEDLTTWTSWNGIIEITAVTGQQIVIAEITADKKCVGAGLATVTSKPTV